jgi:hypothetical protein
MGDADVVVVELARDELQLVISALRLLEDTLGREEADELAEVQAVLRHLDAAAAA